MSDVLAEISAAGTSIWLDDLSRDRLENGSLQSLIDKSHVVGVTTNPSIFANSIAHSALYLSDIRELKREGHDVNSIVRTLTTDDVRRACDLFMPTYEASQGFDGRVSIEVEPTLAHDTKATVASGLALWEEVDRPNALIKVPATVAGLPAIAELISRGVSINVTLIFSIARYKAVMDAFFSGLEARVAQNLPLENIHSVASFFVSRIDSEIDAQLDVRHPNSRLRGTGAIANAHLAYNAFLASISGERWGALKAKGANIQRPLWASTGVKDKSFDPTRYVVELVAPHTVNTMPEATLDAVREKGICRGDTVSHHIERSAKHWESLKELGIDVDAITTHLESDGVQKFEKAWSELLKNVEAAAQ